MQPTFECRSPAPAVSELADGNQERGSWSDAIFRVVHDHDLGRRHPVTMADGDALASRNVC
jgi:hypothetical protein